MYSYRRILRTFNLYNLHCIPFSGLCVQSGVEDGDVYDGAWCALHEDRKQWLQVDALKATRFTGVIVQGRSSIWR